MSSVVPVGRDNSRSWWLTALALRRSIWLQPLGIVGILLVGSWILAAVLAPYIAPYDPIAQNAPLFQPPSQQHVFGTDSLGRDILSRVLWGARLSIPLAVLLVVGTVLIGGVLGAIAGYFGGIVDGVIMRGTDLVFAFPIILLAMTITAALGPGLPNTVLAVLLVAWPRYARLTRGLVSSLGSADYVSATRLFGASTIRALLIDVAPNIAGPITALATVNIGTAVLLLASLSFLGLGSQPPTAEWGSMVATGAQDLTRWWVSLFPGLAIFTVVLGFTFFGDILRDAIDPKSSWSGVGKKD
jgi:peptide/nickel transport system permease protein